MGRSTAFRTASKDLLDTAGIATTYGAEPFRNRVPATDSVVVAAVERRGRGADREVEPRRACAQRHLVRRPDDESVAARRRGLRIERRTGRGDRGRRSSAFSIGSETGGSIVAPAMRCGVTGLRPTFGRVPRTGAMTLCWSLDKLGPMTRTRRGRDARAAGNHRAGRGRRRRACPAGSSSTRTRRQTGCASGYFPEWMKESAGDRRGSSGARDGPDARHDALSKSACPTGPTARSCRCCSPKPRRRSRS